MEYTLPETELVKIKTIEKINNCGVFEIEPLSPGYGVTIGNSLRRILLSSLEGAAITAVKIDGATHQFMSLPKVKEDVVEIILNLKTLRFKIDSDEPVILKLQAKGPGAVKAEAFAENSACSVINKDVHIASLDKGASLNLEVTVSKGRGYVPIEWRKDEKLPIGTISVDSIFTPVKKVHYEVENTRVGGMTNFDKLTLEITTDGSIDPETALGKAAKILVEHFSLVEQACQTEEKAVAEKEEKPKKKTASKKAPSKAKKATKK